MRSEARHVFKRKSGPIGEVPRWVCKRCGLGRRRVVPVAVGSIFDHMPLRSFWLYRLPAGAPWTTALPGCSGLRA